MANGGIHSPYTEDSVYYFKPPVTFSACMAGTLGDSEDFRLTDTKKIVAKLRVTSGHASARQLKRVFEDSDGYNMHLITCVD